MSALLSRLFKIFFKRKLSVIFTLLTPLIIIFVYILVLKSNFNKNTDDFLTKLTYNMPIDDSSLSFIKDRMYSMADQFFICGLLATTSFTIAFSLCKTMIDDKDKEIINDFISTPIKSWKIRYSYIIFNILANWMITTFIFIIAVIYISATNSILFIKPIKLFIVYLISLLGVISSSLLAVNIFWNVKKDWVYSAVLMPISVISGFAIGAYMPVSLFPDFIESIFNLIPASGLSISMRNIIMNDSFNEIINKLNELTNNNFNNSQVFVNLFSIKGNLFGTYFDYKLFTIYASIFTILLGLGILLLEIKHKRRVK
ncbi:ABC transporter permease [Mycoplasma anserisalpingitidis]|uniref:ABC transporter permease n=1 Tax=Mycoplasma anserisalpingitidis TaxID=519450 RepID=A0A5B8KA12_9MOLU|nr:ABC transporter permease [Mycoplasma anserisalpingitidis]QDY88314.1 ABC transporter permease [Mycoplasma anserisalpingitidis]